MADEEPVHIYSSQECPDCEGILTKRGDGFETEWYCPRCDIVWKSEELLLETEDDE